MEKDDDLEKLKREIEALEIDLNEFDRVNASTRFYENAAEGIAIPFMESDVAKKADHLIYHSVLGRAMVNGFNETLDDWDATLRQITGWFAVDVLNSFLNKTDLPLQNKVIALAILFLMKISYNIMKIVLQKHMYEKMGYDMNPFYETDAAKELKKMLEEEKEEEKKNV